MDYRAQELIKQGDNLFDNRSNMMSYWQEAAEQFYPERADFTTSISPGEEMAAHLSSSVPILNRRDLGDMFSSMLRPWNIDWFKITTGNDEDEVPQDAKLWLEAKKITQRNAMQDRVAGFDKATKATDQDYVTFGQGCLKVEVNYRDSAMLVRNRHLRDVVWCEDFTGQIYKVHERGEYSASQLSGMFPENKLHKEVIKALEKDPDHKFTTRQVVLPVDAYERIKTTDRRFRSKFVSVILDVENEHVIEEVPSATLKYVIPRWQTLSGSQYSFSPATVAALPDARLFQSMTLSLLEGAENFSRPPLFIIEEALRGDLNYFAGGVTSIGGKYAEKNMEPLRFMKQDKSGFGYAMEMLGMVRGVLRESWYLNRMRLPQQGPDMTAYEFSERMKEYVRDSMILFSPAETEYNAPLCEMIFEEMLAYGFFGPLGDIPDSLAGSDIKFKFASPFRDAEEREKTGAYLEGLNIIERSTAFDTTATALADMRTGLKDALEGINWPADWFNSEEETEGIRQQMMQQQQQAQEMQMIQQGAEIAKTAGDAGQSINGAMTEA